MKINHKIMATGALREFLDARARGAPMAELKMLSEAALAEQACRKDAGVIDLESARHRRDGAR